MDTHLLTVFLSLSSLTLGPTSGLSAHPPSEHKESSDFVIDQTLVPCILEDNTGAQCRKITTGHLPDGLEIGPFCPANLEEEGGLWHLRGEDAGLYRIDKGFLTKLAGMGYRFYDDQGQVYTHDLSDTPKPSENTCISAKQDSSVTITMLIPAHPKKAARPQELGIVAKLGVSLTGVPIFSEAPQIHHLGDMPALDLCGGHVDPGGWYHWHATASDIETAFKTEGVEASCAVHQDPKALFGYAFDGYEIYGSQDPDGSIPDDLDDCQGHFGPTPSGAETYHYHASEDFPNLPPCLTGVTAQRNFATTADRGIGAVRSTPRAEGNRPGRNAGPMARGRGGPQNQGQGRVPPGFAEAAEKLGISVDQLFKTMQEAGGPRANLSDVAEKLGISEDRLREVLPPPPGRGRRR